MKHIFLILLILLTVNVSGQSYNDFDALPIDKSFKKGILPNGLTYYIKHTNVVKEAASYYIIQNVGSILEKDNQQGLAHFLEHMAFNGTKHFPGKKMLNTLQKHGAVFGKDINAYTSFDETVYNIDNIPTKDGLIDTCLTVLQDWSNYLLLTEQEIDAERGVIKEEWRTRQSGPMRLYQKSLPVKFNYSKYAERAPIGLMSVVENFDYESLREFYHEWYRTDLQAIAVVGDVNVDEVEQKIKDLFSKIPEVKHPKERIVEKIAHNDSLLYSFGTDPEVSTASISMGIRHDKTPKLNTVSELKQSLLESMAVRMLSSRISEMAQKPQTSFFSSSVGYHSLTRTSNVFDISIYPKPDQQRKAFEDVLSEIQRAVNFGYTTSEFDRIITVINTSYKNRISKLEDRSHKAIKGIIQNNYLNNNAITDIEAEYNIVKFLLEHISLTDVHKTIERLYAKSNRFLIVNGVDEQDNLTEIQAKEIINKVEQDTTLMPYTETLANKTLVSDLTIVPGTILNFKTNKEVGATTYVLSNNVKVHYKFVDKQKNRVVLKGLSYGGESLLQVEDLPSANFIETMVKMSGVGDFSATDLKKLLAGKSASLTINLSDIGESISGNSTSKDVETMLQLLYNYFVRPRFDEDAFKILESNIDNYLIRKTNNVNEKMKDSLTIAIYGKNNPRKRIFDREYANDISFEKIESIYNERFENVSDFEFFIVGDLKESDLIPLLQQYLASIPATNDLESYKHNKANEWISDTIKKDVYLAMEDAKANINLAYKKEMSYSPEHVIYASTLGDLMQLRVTETIREAEGGAYSPRAGAHFTREPQPQAYVSFNFDCNPDMADDLLNIVKSEFQKVADGNINQDDLNKIKINYLKERQQAKDKNSFDMLMLTRYFRYNENINTPENFEKIVNNMSKNEIQKIAKQLIEGKSYEIVFKPKQEIK